MERTRYCQRCAEAQTLHDADHPKPCHRCGGTNFALEPKKHAWHYGVYVLTEEDRNFLRCQRIKED